MSNKKYRSEDQRVATTLVVMPRAGSKWRYDPSNQRTRTANLWRLNQEISIIQRLAWPIWDTATMSDPPIVVRQITILAIDSLGRGLVETVSGHQFFVDYQPLEGTIKDNTELWEFKLITELLNLDDRTYDGLADVDPNLNTQTQELEEPKEKPNAS